MNNKLPQPVEKPKYFVGVYILYQDNTWELKSIQVSESLYNSDVRWIEEEVYDMCYDAKLKGFSEDIVTLKFKEKTKI